MSIHLIFASTIVAGAMLALAQHAAVLLQVLLH
jgi:hypothetical protein